MNTTTPQHHAPPQSATSHPVDTTHEGSAWSDHPTWREALQKTVPIVDAPAFFGPPVSFLLGPWLLLVLLLIGPFALVVTLLLVLGLAVGLLAMVAVVIASPYLLVRHLRAHGVVHAHPRAPRFRKHRVSSGGLGSPQPKGVS